MKTGILLILALGFLGAPPPASASDRACRRVPGGYTPGHEQTLFLTAAGTLFPRPRG
jgi:hypothetical protein